MGLRGTNMVCGGYRGWVGNLTAARIPCSLPLRNPLAPGYVGRGARNDLGGSSFPSIYVQIVLRTTAGVDASLEHGKRYRGLRAHSPGSGPADGCRRPVGSYPIYGNPLPETLTGVSQKGYSLYRVSYLRARTTDSALDGYTHQERSCAHGTSLVGRGLGEGTGDRLATGSGDNWRQVPNQLGIDPQETGSEPGEGDMGYRKP